MLGAVYAPIAKQKHTKLASRDMISNQRKKEHQGTSRNTEAKHP
jgi:hypothetical protein